MKAVIFDDFGSPDVLRIADVQRPVATTATVLVKVMAVAVNHVDTFVRSGTFKTALSAPHVAGRDLVGPFSCNSRHRT